MNDSFKTKATLSAGGATVTYFSLETLAKEHPEVRTLPYSLKVLLENLLRHEDGRVVKKEDILALAKWDPKAEPDKEIAFHPARVLMQDFTGVPAVVDLAAMREAIVAMGGDPARVNPLSPADLVIDHSVQVDNFASSLAFGQNVELEYERNRERYEFLRWGQSAFKNFRVVPPGTGICHQVNLEYLAKVVWTNEEGVAYPDTLVGTDSHTTMINGLGVLGWGVGGIEAEAALLGQPVSMLIPDVVGMKLFGKLPEGATATDLVLTVTQILRKKGVVGKFVEFYGPGLAALALTDRATIANMAPEYGATMGFFPVDGETIKYLEFTGRKALAAARRGVLQGAGPLARRGRPRAALLRHARAQPRRRRPVARRAEAPAGPRRRSATRRRSTARASPAMLAKGAGRRRDRARSPRGASQYELPHGAVVIAAITSCTNTSNPSVLIARRPPREEGRRARPRREAVGQDLARPRARRSSPTTSRAAGLMPYLEALGFHLVGYGCTTCIGNSGPLPEKVSEAVRTGDLVVASVLSGNRNFEGRVNPQVQDELPRLAAARRRVRPRRRDGPRPDDRAARQRPQRHGPSSSRTSGRRRRRSPRRSRKSIEPAPLREGVRRGLRGRRAAGSALTVPKGDTFAWDEKSTYVRKPTFFENLGKEPKPLADVTGRPLPRPPRRLHHDRPHLPRRQHREDLAGGEVPRRQRRRSPPTSTSTAPAAATTK